MTADAQLPELDLAFAAFEDLRQVMAELRKQESFVPVTSDGIHRDPDAIWMTL